MRADRRTVGVAGLAWVDVDVEILPQVGGVALEGGNTHRLCEPAQDLVHGEEAAVITEDRVYRVTSGVGLLDEVPRRAVVVEGSADLVT
jgi:hypothetical protein